MSACDHRHNVKSSGTDAKKAGESGAVQLSVVATSRNDDHGGSLLYRMQHFVDGFVAQCKRHRLAAELILVEWNPPTDRPPLAEALRWPEDPSYATIRIVTVPPAVHARLAHSKALSLFQMIAKNVGIRRARGRFVLATNIDILFSDNVIRFMRGRLRGGRLYRVDRGDVPPTIPPDATFEQTLAFCESQMFRIHKRGRSLVKRHGRWVRIGPLRKKHDRIARLARASAEFARSLYRAAAQLPRHMVVSLRIARRLSIMRILRGLRNVAWRAKARRLIGGALGAVVRRFAVVSSFAAEVWRHAVLWLRTHFDRRYRLHTNACGDFTLLSREDWFSLRGYPEWEIFSWHVDSVLLHQAICSGIREIDLPTSYRIYHIEHSIGSGYTPEGVETLFARLEKKGIPHISWSDFLELVADMDARKRSGQAVVFNDENWGFRDIALPEMWIGAAAQYSAA